MPEGATRLCAVLCCLNFARERLLGSQEDFRMPLKAARNAGPPEHCRAPPERWHHHVHQSHAQHVQGHNDHALSEGRFCPWNGDT
jgi:hypothetical protein